MSKADIVGVEDLIGMDEVEKELDREINKALRILSKVMFSEALTEVI